MKIHHKIFKLSVAKALGAALCLWLSAATPTLAQLELVPLGPFHAATPSYPIPSPARTQALTLPFFDDFSTSTTQPDTRLWLEGSGVYINNTQATTQPSINVATLDGFDAQGVPYSFTGNQSEQRESETDSLTSQPIDLSGSSAADSVYLSFFWQAKGLGELPDLADSLWLEFRDSKNQWKYVWGKKGARFDSLFQQAFVAVLDKDWFHAAFQFRFRATGRLSGGYDTWHIDYIYLNKNRSANDRFIKDVAVRKPLTPLLKNYSALPFRQYFADPAAHTADSVHTDIINHFNNFNFTSYTFTIVDEVANKEIQRYQEPVSSIIASGQTQKKSIAIQPFPIPASAQRMRLHYKFDLLTTDDQNPTIPTVNLRRNDTLSAYTDIADYYAYDDGSAEYGVRMHQKLGRTAMRFVATVPDTLGGIRMALVPFMKDLTGQAFTIQVFSNRNGKPDQVLYQRSVRVGYGTSRNEFMDYPFESGVAVTDTFYVGWLQISQDPVVVGFDRNSPQGSEQLFTSLSTEWAATPELKGSIMIRPYTGGKVSDIITPTEPLPTLNVTLYPNPTSGIIRWNNQLINQIDIFSLQGIKIRTLYPSNGQSEASLQDLPEAMYLLRVTDGSRTRTQKIVIKK